MPLDVESPWAQSENRFDFSCFVVRRYWSNFSKVLYEAEKKDIVICIQLYQRWYWGNSEARNRLFFHRDYNVNNIHEIDPRTFWKHTSDSYPNGKLWRVHENFVKNVLNAIGNHRNVIIDLMNEGSLKEGVTRAWIDRTLEIIQQRIECKES